MLENINKNKYVRAPFELRKHIVKDVTDWITERPEGFHKWKSPFGELECECTGVGYYEEDEFYEDDIIDCEILAVCWRKDAPFYKGEIWKNEPDVVIEYEEFEDNWQDLHSGWRVFFHIDFIERKGSEELKDELFKAKLRTEIDYASDEFFKLWQLKWGCQK